MNIFNVLPVATVATFALAVPALAHGHCFICAGPDIATATAEGGGSNGTGFFADRSVTESESDLDLWVKTQTDPLLAVSSGQLQQQTGGIAVDDNFLVGGLYQNGWLRNQADINKHDHRNEEVATVTNGVAGLLGTANGDDSIVVGYLDAKSDQAEIAMDYPHGGYEASRAEQTIEVGLTAVAGGNGPSSTTANGGASSLSMASD